MVKFRGVEINVISQFDICKLPEYAATTSNDTDPFLIANRSENHSAPSYPTATCYIPIYPGSQIWFEYTIDGPHPAGASYFFKLFVNGVTITSWDCTARHGFHGKMMYNLVHEGRGQVKRQALKFGDGIGDGQGEDAVRFHVHRIERRVRVREIEEGVGRVNPNTPRADGLRLINSGLLEPGFRPRRYKYQLVDPVDMPYAAFQFRCRPIEFLEEQRMIPFRSCDSRISARSSMTSLSSGNVSLAPSPAQAHVQGVAVRPLASSPSNKVTPTGISAEKKEGKAVEAPTPFTQVLLSDSNDSLSIKTKDSIEDLQSNVRRSPRSLVSPKTKKDSEIPPSPTRSPRSPRRRLTKKLTVNTSSTNSDFERKLRPLSPFTGGGMLRKASVQAQKAPASATESRPTDEEELKTDVQEDRTETLAKPQKSILNTTAEERGGKKLMGFLARRFAGETSTKGNGNDATDWFHAISAPSHAEIQPKTTVMFLVRVVSVLLRINLVTTAHPSWSLIALAVATPASHRDIDRTSPLNETISTMTDRDLALATAHKAPLADEVLRMTSAEHNPDYLRESSTFVAVPAVRTDVAKPATRDAIDTTTRNLVAIMMTATRLLHFEVEHTMTEMPLAHHEITAVVVAADVAVLPKEDRLVEANRARR